MTKFPPALHILRAEPLTDEERARLDEINRKWPERIVGKLTPEQRKAFRALLLKKREPKKKRGGQLKWDRARLVRLLALYQDARKRGYNYEQSIELLSLIFNHTTKWIEKNLSQARKLPPLESEKK